ncbi:hypothetical protein, variant [Aphanomyces invadans]|uniref:RGS domain-containing protein n=1 Tax=Aphanomyces invadans TaxID=157072 RepID=A0A024UPZ2_9STRA|nr:hypothetical protein, variant [Aphanomyces invadans]ETW07713.1 hypothetical protein, variant [Aphanomyces invadans]|eukprot:XP_008863806.1 hypothetical protein, variant [Aphanomyces invadans]
MRSVREVNCSLALGTDEATTAIATPPDGIIRVVLYMVFVSGLYIPIVIGLYLRHRRNPAIRYRNPIEMAVTAIWIFLYCCARCAGALFVDSIPCATRYLSFGVPLQMALLGYFLAELRVVVTFKLTELMVAHSNRKRVNETNMMLMRTFLHHGWTSAPRVFMHAVANLPLFVVLYAPDYNPCDLSVCPTRVVDNVTFILYGEFGAMVVVTLILAVLVRTVVENFGLRLAFQRSGRVFLLAYTIYVPILVVHYDNDTLAKWHVDVLVNVALGHAFIGIHIVHPLWESYLAKSLPVRAHVAGTVGILDAYLQTNDGFRDFSTFAKSEFMYECVVAWKHLADFRLMTPTHLSAADIYAMHIAPRAPLSLANSVPSDVLKRYDMVFQANHKYAVNDSSVGEYDNKFYDPLLKHVRDRLIQETLPRFQRHPMGAGWAQFVTQYAMIHALDKLLVGESKAQTTHTNASTQSKKKKRSLESVKTAGRLVPIASERDSVDAPDRTNSDPST